MPIGETLAEARQRAGLTVAQVSEQTCLRETVIEAIEGEDYSACGGEFYARADIRSIARAVGTDSGPLIAEYDELRRAGAPVAHEPGRPAYRPRGRWLNRVVVLGLVAVLAFGVYIRLSGSRHAAAGPPAGGQHAAVQQPGGPGGPGAAPKLTHAAVTPAPAPKPTGAATAPAPAPTVAHAATAPAPATVAPAQATTPASTGTAGPGGGNPPPAQRATGGNHATGPARPVVHQRPRPEPGLSQRSAHRQARPSHDHRRRHHHRRHAPAAQQVASQSTQYLPGQGR